MKRLLALSLALIIAMTALSACDTTDPPATDPATSPTTQGPGQTTTTTKPADTTAPSQPSRTVLKMASTQTYVSVDPHFRTLIADGTLVGLTYESFFSYNSLFEVTPRLAEKYEVSADGLEYTYYLKKGAKFQDGEDVKVSDVIFSFERAMTSPTLIAETENIEKIEEVDSSTVKITLKHMVPEFFYQACSIYIVSEKAVANAQDKYEYLAAGSGPYTIDTWRPDEKVVLKRFEGYHGNLAPIETVEYIIFGDSASALIAFESGDIDYLGIPKADWARIVDSGQYSTFLSQGQHTTFMVFNMEKEPFTDIRVRQAFSYAINKEDVLYGAMEDLGLVATMVGSPDLCLGTPAVDEMFQYEYNPDKARQLLKEAGYENGLVLSERAGTLGGSHFEKALLILQDQLADVGIEFEVEIIDSAVYGDVIRTGNFLFQVWGITPGTYASYLQRVYGTSGIGDLNGSRYSNPQVDALFDKAKITPDENERNAIYKELFNICAEDAPIIPLYWQSNCIAWNKDLNVDPYKSLATWSWN